jgi:hypothetical protein
MGVLLVDPVIPIVMTNKAWLACIIIDNRGKRNRQDSNLRPAD